MPDEVLPFEALLPTRTSVMGNVRSSPPAAEQKRGGQGLDQSRADDHLTSSLPPTSAGKKPRKRVSVSRGGPGPARSGEEDEFSLSVPAHEWAGSSETENWSSSHHSKSSGGIAGDHSGAVVEASVSSFGASYSESASAAAAASSSPTTPNTTAPSSAAKMKRGGLKPRETAKTLASKKYSQERYGGGSGSDSKGTGGGPLSHSGSKLTLEGSSEAGEGVVVGGAASSDSGRYSSVRVAGPGPKNFETSFLDRGLEGDFDYAAPLEIRAR